MREFDGSAVVVSHDRYFLNRVADLLIVFEGPGRVQVVHGNFDTYERLRAVQAAGGGSRAAAGRALQPATARAAPGKPAKRKRKFPYRKVEDLEAEISAGEADLARLEAALADGDLYRDQAKVQETLTAFEVMKARLRELYEHWEEAEDLN